MKTMKPLILTLLFLLPLSLLAMNVIQDAESTPTFGGVVWNLAQITLIQAIALAFVHIVAKTFDLKVWFKNNGLPAVLAFGIATGLAAIDIYLATTVDVVIEMVIGETTNAYDYQALVVIAFVLVPVVQSFMFGNVAKTQAKVAAKK